MRPNIYLAIFIVVLAKIGSIEIVLESVRHLWLADITKLCFFRRLLHFDAFVLNIKNCIVSGRLAQIEHLNAKDHGIGM